MLTEGESNLIVSIIKFSTRICVCPMEWRPKYNMLVTTRNHLKLLCFQFFNIWKIIYVSCGLLQFFPLTRFGRCDSEQLEIKIFHFIFIFCWGMISAESLISYIYRDEMSTLYNQLRSFNKTRGIQFQSSEYLITSGLFLRERFLKIFCIGTLLLNLGLQMVPLIWPEACFLHRSFLRVAHFNGSSEFWMESVIPKILEFVNLSTGLSNHLFTISILIVFYITLIFWTNRMKDQACGENLNEVIILLRSLTVITNLFNQIFSSVLIPAFKLVTTVMACLGIAVVVRLHETLPHIYLLVLPGIGISGYIHVLSLCYCSSKIYENTDGLPRHVVKHAVYTNGKLLKIFRKQLRSCQPLKIYFGNIYFAKRSTPITVLGFIVNTTVYLLLAK